MRNDYQLADNLSAKSGQIFLTGTQALVRLPLMQRWLDAERGLNTGGFISGYRGSPLGAYDQQLWRAQKALDANGIRFLPAVNEELGATAVLGSQQVESDPKKTVDGVFAIWYGKGPGVDRAADALKHGNAYGSSPHGGVLVVAGDDHGCMSSSMPHQSELSMQAWSMPVLNPSNIAEVLEFGLYGWALSRFSGAWIGLKAISETIESGSTVDLDKFGIRFATPSGFIVPSGGLNYRWPDLPSLAIEARLIAKLDAARAFAYENPIDKSIAAAPDADVGIVTCGKAHLDLLEALRRLGLSPDELNRAGVRLYKVGQSFPIEPRRMLAFAQGLREILVIEEKAPVVERQVKELFYNRTKSKRPLVLGKQNADGAPLLSDIGELRPSRVMPVVADWLARHRPALDRRDRVKDFIAPELLSNDSDAVRRVPYFCSGCPHNTSTNVPEGSQAQAGIGCHFMASWMPERPTTGLIQMGGEGVDWAAHSMFTSTPHVFQNLGDGTYFHSGYLAIRQSIAAKSNITYKILFNDAVAMTGGQPVDGPLTVEAIARQTESEGAARVVVVSDEPDKYDAYTSRFPRGTTFHDRSELDAVQRELRDIPGVTILIYDQTCAAEKRRRRKKGTYPDPSRRLFINTAVCEGCGDCGVQSNCLSIVPVETDLGRKRMVEQASCNKDYSCVNGFCPSFVSVYDGKVRKWTGADSGTGTEGISEHTDEQPMLERDGGESRLPVGDQMPEQARAPNPAAQLATLIALLPAPEPHRWTGPYDLLVAGVGGTGVVTVGALITMAANLENKSASVLDFMGFAQKGGMVLSYVRIADVPERLNQVRIDTQQADAILACDMVVGASNDSLQTAKQGRTKIVANTHEIHTASFVHNPDADLHGGSLLEKMRFAAGPERVTTCDAQMLAERMLGDSIGANLVMMGFAWQLGLIPVSLEAIERAIELNGVAIPMNKAAVALGRLAAGNPEAIAGMIGEAKPVKAAAVSSTAELDALIARRAQLLTEYQDGAYATRYRSLVDTVRAAERRFVAVDEPLGVTAAVARNYAKLMAYKDEYEVARLYTNGVFAKQLAAQFDGRPTLQFHMAPPLLSKGANGRPRKMTFGGWMWTVLRVLAPLKALRGSMFDVFGHALERRMERALIMDYAQTIEVLAARLEPGNRALIEQVASLPEKVRGFGHVKIANLRSVKRQEAELLRQLGVEPVTGDAVRRALESVPIRGGLDSIPVVTSR
ncbi:MAG: indolepyruvate ferredoxin oxidoreductase family protein [Betaproteobacteria bacterium]